LQTATHSDDCKVAGTAMLMLGSRFAPSRSSKPMDQLRALCFAATALPSLPNEYIDPNGLTFVDHSDGSEIVKLPAREVTSLNQDAVDTMRGNCTVKGAVITCRNLATVAEFGFGRTTAGYALRRLVVSDATKPCESTQ
jgi:hypothetical protein